MSASLREKYEELYANLEQGVDTLPGYADAVHALVSRQLGVEFCPPFEDLVSYVAEVEEILRRAG